jgi:hypothetical protein
MDTDSAVFSASKIGDESLVELAGEPATGDSSSWILGPCVEPPSAIATADIEVMRRQTAKKRFIFVILFFLFDIGDCGRFVLPATV